MAAPAPAGRSPDLRARIVLAATLVAGWCAFDAVVFLTSGDPHEALELVPRSLLAVLVAGGAGALSAFLPRLPWLALAGGLLALGADRLGILARDSTGVAALSVLALFFLLGRWLRARSRLGAARTGIALGLLACMGFALLRTGPGSRLMVFAPLALALLAVGFVRPPAWRALATLVLVAFVLVPLVRRVGRALRVPRPDLPAPETAAAPGRPNLLLVVFDTVRADHLSAYGYARETTPGLAAFAAEHATRYETARSTSSWTLPSHASLFTGLMPSEHGADHSRDGTDEDTLHAGVMRPARRLRADVPTLAERLRAAGYRTAAVVANSAYLDHEFGLDRGFEHYDDRPGSNAHGHLALAQILGAPRRSGRGIYRDARRISAAARAWLAELEPEEPFFLMLNYMDAHHPLLPPPPYDRAFEPLAVEQDPAPGSREAVLLYDRSLLYLDAQVSDLLRWLEETGRFDDTVVIVTADHGEALGERGGFADHAWLLYEELLRVPLLVKPAGGRDREREAAPTSLVEVYHLALRLTGLETSEDREPGPAAEWYHGPTNPRIERWAAGAGRDLEADLLVWLEGERKYIVSSKGVVEAYDLGRDPQELAPLALAPDELAAARARAAAWWQAHPAIHSELPVLDAARLEALRALGYVGDRPN